MSTVTVDDIMGNDAWPQIAESKLKRAQQDANDRALRYGIKDRYKFNEKLGICWLVQGGPKNQTYKSETAILRAYAENLANLINLEAARKAEQNA